jgi:hypothetical protein
LNGATLHDVWAIVLEARVVLDDLEAPVVGRVEPEGLADGAWHRGPAEVVFSAEDNTGVRERRVVVGGVVRGSVVAPGAADGGCADGVGAAFAHPQPCAGERGTNGRVGMVVDPCPWGDGRHEVRPAALDVDGGETVGQTAEVLVDCSAPVVQAAVVGDAVAGGTLAVRVDVQDGASGPGTPETQVRVDGGAWQRYDAPVTVGAGRRYEFRARVADRAGNVSAWAMTSPVVGRVAPAAPFVPVVDSAPVLPSVPETSTGGDADVAPGTAPTAPVTQTRPAPPRSARLRVNALRRQGVWVRIGGSTAVGCARRVDVVLRLRSVRARRTVRQTTRVTSAGAWSLRVRAGRSWRVRDVSAHTAAGAGCAAGRTTLRPHA